MRPSANVAMQTLFSDKIRRRGRHRERLGPCSAGSQRSRELRRTTVTSLLTTTVDDGQELTQRSQSVLIEAGWFVRCTGTADVNRWDRSCAPALSPGSTQPVRCTPASTSCGACATRSPRSSTPWTSCCCATPLEHRPPRACCREGRHYERSHFCRNFSTAYATASTASIAAW